MRISSWLNALLLGAVLSLQAAAQTAYIVRVSDGLASIQSVCGGLNCAVGNQLDGNLGHLFLVTAPTGADPASFLASLLGQPGIVDAEIDLIANTSRSAPKAPPALTDTAPVPYYGTTVIDGYIHQPATSLINLNSGQNAFNASGAGIVAVIDTGVDPGHPVLKNVLLPGYDFTRNSPVADETLDVLLPAAPIVNGSNPAWTNDRSSALVDQSTAAVIDGNPQYGDFGHGTMVAGVIHLTAPTAQILPLKAFRSDGTGNNSDIIRAIYYATQQNASVINMSFNLAGDSREVRAAIDAANLKGIVSVAAAGNAGTSAPLYPASYPEVMGVASTTNNDQLSSFSSYGSTVWVGAPGEGVVTTYPYSTFAAAWGTSFSAPFVSGTVALMRSMQLFCNQGQSAQAVAHAQTVNAAIGNGRLDVAQALSAWAKTLGL